ncbi:MAG: ribonuclease H-like domain-containing protein [Lachnospiraceae bacterium]|nr:ribonuclease H-like domain-containing protein [Lachnospiraceae bacterium]
MITRTTVLSDIPDSVYNDLPTDPEQVLLVDIETTGFDAVRSDLYLIGCCYHDGGVWKTDQFFAENKYEQAEILLAF